MTDIEPSGQRSKGRGYSWPPFEKGHTRTLHHGMRSPRVYGPIAEEKLAALLAAIEAEEIEFASRPSFQFALEGLATTLAQVDLGRRHVVDKHETGECEREGCLNQLATNEKTLDRRLDAMGLTARSRATIQSALSATARNVTDISSLIEQGKAIRQAREKPPKAPGSTNPDDAA